VCYNEQISSFVIKQKLQYRFSKMALVADSEGSQCLGLDEGTSNVTSLGDIAKGVLGFAKHFHVLGCDCYSNLGDRYILMQFQMGKLRLRDGS
jgi:hypothetical protein